MANGYDCQGDGCGYVRCICHPAWGEVCDGSAECKAPLHILGCFAGPKERVQPPASSQERNPE